MRRSAPRYPPRRTSLRQPQKAQLVLQARRPVSKQLIGLNKNVMVFGKPCSFGTDAFGYPFDSAVDESQFLAFDSDISTPRSLDSASTLSSEEFSDYTPSGLDRMSFPASYSQGPYIASDIATTGEADEFSQIHGTLSAHPFSEGFQDASQYITGAELWEQDQSLSPVALPDSDFFFESAHGAFPYSSLTQSLLHHGDAQTAQKQSTRQMLRHIEPAGGKSTRPSLLPRTPASEQISHSDYVASSQSVKQQRNSASGPSMSHNSGINTPVEGSIVDKESEWPSANDISITGEKAGKRLSNRKSPESVASGDDAEEEENARTHPLYNASPGTDGFYLCPQAVDDPTRRISSAEPKCDHQPVKLKCDYDKHLDSHLKPYRCKIGGCEELKFSSTACRLRHEREAHGSHGHGLKPYNCIFQDCDRAKPGNGFPRAWNCNDHMKRCHGYKAPLPIPPTNGENAPESPGVNNNNAANTRTKGPGRKKRAAPDEPSSPPPCEKKQRTDFAETPAADIAPCPSLTTSPNYAYCKTRPHPADQMNEVEKLKNEWRHRHRKIHDAIHDLRRFDDDKLLYSIHEHSARMQAISMKIKRYASTG